MSERSTAARPPAAEFVKAGVLAPWQVDEIPAPPPVGWRQWRALLGPGVLLAGASVGAGEWLFGPAVSAQYGATLMWLATVSIVCQLFLNLEVMRYALYCGEPVVVGYFRTRPGPWLWTFFYLLMDTPLIWPYMASNAAVPLAAALLGHLPGSSEVAVLGLTFSESGLVKFLGYVVFLGSFVPLIFGGSVYKMLERIMTAKVVLVLAYLTLVVLFMVSTRNILEVVSGFFRFGVVPYRAETVVHGRHFTLGEQEDSTSYIIKGTTEGGQTLVTAFSAGGMTYGVGTNVPPELQGRMQQMLRQASSLAKSGQFYVRRSGPNETLTLSGAIASDGSWRARHITVESNGTGATYRQLHEVPEPTRQHAEALLSNQGLEQGNLLSYLWQHGELPPLDWALLAAFASIAGAGGMTNTAFSNYARDKGWGMGAKVGAIPSAVGGRTIALSHVGKVFHLNPQTLQRWRGWVRHIVRDQVGVWMLCSFLGMALPCMLSLEFIRNAPVAGDRVAAMTAEGIAQANPGFSQLLWGTTLLCGFLVLAPGQIFASDSLARRWTDIAWVANPLVQRLRGNQVKYIYYGILLIYGVWGLFALSLFDPLQIAKIGGVLSNLALGFTAFHTLYVNRAFLPEPLQPGVPMQLGLVFCGTVFLWISTVGLLGLFGTGI